MTYSKLPGVYFSETVQTESTAADKIPMFIVVSTTTYASLDEQLVKVAGITALSALLTGSDLEATTDIIAEALTEAGNSEGTFYLYSTKATTATALTQIITDVSSKDDIEDIFYIEENAVGSLTFQQVMNAFKTGTATAYANGSMKIVYGVPYKTVTDAVEAASSTPAANTMVTTVTGIAAAVVDSRIGIIVPDYAGVQIGRITSANYNEEVGYDAVNTGITALTYSLSYSQELTLQNAGVLFLRKEKVQGSAIYRINLGVSTAFANSTADGQLICRRIADEVLRQIKNAADAYIKDKANENTVTFLQTDVDTVIANFSEAGDVDEESTALTVSEGSNPYTFNVNGTIKPIRSIIAIEVNTTIA